MQYPPAVRTLLGAMPFASHIDGKAKVRLLQILDTFFGPDSHQTISINGEPWHFETTNPNERFLYYLTFNLLSHARTSPLHQVMRHVFRNRSGLFIDVGANLGLFSYLARQAGIMPLLFEPEPSHHAFLARNAAVFGETFPFALSDQEGEMDFYVGDVQHSGANSLVCPGHAWRCNPYASCVRVDTQTFDGFCAQHNVTPSAISFIKVDVEGHEEAVIRGMKAHLAHPQAAIIWCEVRGPDSNRGRNSYAAVIDFVGRFGFQPYVFDQGRLRSFDAATDVTRIFEVLLAHPQRHRAALFDSVRSHPLSRV